VLQTNKVQPALYQKGGRRVSDERKALEKRDAKEIAEVSFTCRADCIHYRVCELHERSREEDAFLQPKTRLGEKGVVVCDEYGQAKPFEYYGQGPLVLVEVPDGIAAKMISLPEGIVSIAQAKTTEEMIERINELLPPQVARSISQRLWDLQEKRDTLDEVITRQRERTYCDRCGSAMVLPAADKMRLCVDCREEIAETDESEQVEVPAEAKKGFEPPPDEPGKISDEKYLADKEAAKHQPRVAGESDEAAKQEPCCPEGEQGPTGDREADQGGASSES
jgi:ribosomal protein L37AE/L43A